MKKAAKWLFLAAFKVPLGRAKPLERCLESRMNASAIIFKIYFVPLFVPRFCL
jgi:hypothetical protein